MLFSSIVFIFYFLPTVFIIYYLVSFSRMLQNIVLLLGSLLFYAWGEPTYVVLMIFSILVNSSGGLLIEKINNRATGKKILVCVIFIDLMILFLFKYLGFVVDNLNMALNTQINVMDLPLPIGISFFTFQAISYVVDVYRGVTKAENPFYAGLYIAFFPQLIAGPIVKYHSIAEQIRSRKSTVDKISVGISRFTVGLGKKILLANTFAFMADTIFNQSQIGIEKVAVPAMLAWLGSLAYTLQIYFDFSAYSDMAIGLALCFGFRLEENFNYPYIATSISDFWRRWHISLTSFFREYVYFPLGGSRVKNQDYMVRNIFIVWLLTGIWHGANWTFIFWGLYYFFIQLAERFFEFEETVKNKLFKHIYTLFIVNLGWIFFRSDSLYQAGRYIMNMFALNNNGIYSELAVCMIKENWVFLVLGIIFSTPIAIKMNDILYKNREKSLNTVYTLAYPICMLLLLIISISYLVSGSYNPFIYFNF